MDHEQKRHERHEHDRKEKRAEGRRAEAAFSQPGRPAVRPLWSLAAGLVLSGVALLIWMQVKVVPGPPPRLGVGDSEGCTPFRVHLTCPVRRGQPALPIMTHPVRGTGTVGWSSALSSRNKANFSTLGTPRR